MPATEQKEDIEIHSIWRAQRDLVEAHIALVKMQQSLLSGAVPALSPGAESRPIKTAQPSSSDAGHSAQFGLSDSLHPKSGFNQHASPDSNQEADIANDSERGSQTQDGPALRFLAKFGASVILPLILGIMVLALLFRSPRELTELRTQLSSLRQQQFEAMSQSSDALKKAQAELAATQTKLEQTEAALNSTEQALRETQQGSGNTNKARTSPAVARPPGPAPVEAKPVSGEQRLAQAQQDLRNIRTALMANQRELINNLREYRAIAQALAKNRQSIFQTGLEIRRTKGEISNEELTAQKKSWEEFLPPKVRPLMTDSRLEVAADVLSGAAIQGEGVHGLRPEDNMPATLPETLALVKKSVAELTALMKQLTNTQADIIQAQSELTDAMGALGTVTREFLALQAATADSKSGSTSSASAETGKPSANDAPDASATKPAVKK